MLMFDAGVLVYAHREDEPRHAAYAGWLQEAIDSPRPFALSVLVATAFVRIVTNARIFARPTPLALALAFVEEIAGHPRCRLAAPGRDHLAETARLCRATGAVGKLVADAEHAAVAIAQGCTWASADGDFARFEPHGLSWRHVALA